MDYETADVPTRLKALLIYEVRQRVTAGELPQAVLEELVYRSETPSWAKGLLDHAESTVPSNLEVPDFADKMVEALIWMEGRLLSAYIESPVPVTREPKSVSANTRVFGWTRFWELFKYLLPHKTREKVYEPARNELMQDYLETRKEKSKVVRAWLNFCFTFRTVLLVADCWRCLIAQTALGWLLKSVPEPIRRWWTG